ncbi:MAG: hypothetical protein ACLTXL_13480 [Clostridia bacterium]
MGLLDEACDSDIRMDCELQRFQYEVEMLIRQFLPFSAVGFGGTPGAMRLELSAHPLAGRLYDEQGRLIGQEQWPDQGGKNQAKAMVYRLFSAYLGQRLPWGILTGVRPSKIPMILWRAGDADGSVHLSDEGVLVRGRKQNSGRGQQGAHTLRTMMAWMSVSCDSLSIPVCLLFLCLL